MLIGKAVAEKKTIKSDELKQYVDDVLFKCCFTPLGTEENDTTLLDELLGETMMYVIGQGINRRQRRS